MNKRIVRKKVIFFAVMCGPEKTNPKMQDAEILEVADKSQK